MGYVNRCRIAQEIMEEGLQKAQLFCLQSLMQTSGVPFPEACDLLDIPSDDRPQLELLLSR